MRVSLYLRFLLFGPFREISPSFSNRFGSSGKIYGYNLVPAGKFRLENLRGGRKQTMIFAPQRAYVLPHARIIYYTTHIPLTKAIPVTRSLLAIWLR